MSGNTGVDAVTCLNDWDGRLITCLSNLERTEGKGGKGNQKENSPGSSKSKEPFCFGKINFKVRRSPRERKKDSLLGK